MAGSRNRGGLIGSAGRFARRYLSGLWSRHWPRLAVACVYAVLLLELQVRETTDCLGRHRGFRRFIEELPVVLHGLIDALLRLPLSHVRTPPLHVCHPPLPSR